MNNSLKSNAMDELETITDIFDKFFKIVRDPKCISRPTEKVVKNLKGVAKELYDHAKQRELAEGINYRETLPELIIHDFDSEQIWQQVELQNAAILEDADNSNKTFEANTDKLWLFDRKTFNKIKKNSSDFDTEIQDAIEKLNEDIKESKFMVDEQKTKKKKSKPKKAPKTTSVDDKIIPDDTHDEDPSETINKSNKYVKPSIVDDEFFKLREMEEFLINEEKDKKQKPESDSEDDHESVDLFDDVPEASDDDDEDKELKLKEYNPRYNDFFGRSNDGPTQSNRDEAEDEDGSEEDMESEHSDDNEPVVEQKSSLEVREERLKKKIERIEEAALQEKPWQLKGEVTGDKRPENSLLQEIIEFDITTRPAPVITQETTFILEDVIKQRIKDKAWDSVERKVKPVEAPTEYKKKLMLDQEKSKHSLAQIYEQEYVKQKEALDPDAEEKPEEEPKEHLEIKTMMKNLFAKLDALSNFHFTPKAVGPELRVISNMPAINMEEVAPVAVSDAALLAPEEVKKKLKGDEIGKGERTRTDKKRERRKKKLKQHEHAKIKEKKDEAKKLRPGQGGKQRKTEMTKLVDKVTKNRNVDKLDETLGSKSTKSSSAFFTQLEDEVKSFIKSKTKKQKQSTDNPLHVAKKLKL